MTRRTLFKALAGLPVVGRLAPLGADTGVPGLYTFVDHSLTKPVTHYVGGDFMHCNAPRDQWFPTIDEAMEHVVEGRGDRIVVAPVDHEPA